ncbi:penicillin-insensitive murein endopeptidase [Plasticicumulans acidivorans]|uniref:Penicillin-insensitive murein endopeptidase n=1 Tax=Plasticicumulans acidivorans TaxID=886464 RepID=A0A317MVH7_9GAMM|nr:penicillin-insensitive murein endopeptidase [Plasticicumulans acidivorans]PWV58505.1 penicillin-insensitive murein endopeptidase [Plasticicumulans acidivorans]
MLPLRRALSALALAGLAWNATASPWSEVNGPSQGAPRIYGGFAAGCIAGAQALPIDGDGYQLMRLSRHRNFGHPTLLRFIEYLGHAADARGLGPVLIGDLGQARGGPMSFGHRSHQIGLDVDVWFREAPSGRRLDPRARESLPMLTMIDAANGRVLPARWGSRQRELLRLAATRPEVERIFVNPVIKQNLCRSERDTAWLAKLRPWWSHDEHFHVRLRCPGDSPDCEPQKPIPADDGCDENLARWVIDIERGARRPKPPAPPPPAPELPVECSSVLLAPTAR